jgi:hypothetical protein
MLFVGAKRTCQPICVEEIYPLLEDPTFGAARDDFK